MAIELYGKVALCRLTWLICLFFRSALQMSQVEHVSASRQDRQGGALTRAPDPPGIFIFPIAKYIGQLSDYSLDNTHHPEKRKRIICVILYPDRFSIGMTLCDP